MPKCGGLIHWSRWDSRPTRSEKADSDSRDGFYGSNEIVSFSIGIVASEFRTNPKAKIEDESTWQRRFKQHQAPVASGKATPAPPVGTALGPHGLNIMDFCKQFNAKTAKEPDGMIFPVLVTVYTDRTFTFILKTPPASVLLKRAANIGEGFRRAEPQ